MNKKAKATNLELIKTLSNTMSLWINDPYNNWWGIDGGYKSKNGENWDKIAIKHFPDELEQFNDGGVINKFQKLLEAIILDTQTILDLMTISKIRVFGFAGQTPLNQGMLKDAVGKAIDFYIANGGQEFTRGLSISLASISYSGTAEDINALSQLVGAQATSLVAQTGLRERYVSPEEIDIIEGIITQFFEYPVEETKLGANFQLTDTEKRIFGGKSGWDYAQWSDILATPELGSDLKAYIDLGDANLQLQLNELDTLDVLINDESTESIAGVADTQKIINQQNKTKNVQQDILIDGLTDTIANLPSEASFSLISASADQIISAIETKINFNIKLDSTKDSIIEIDDINNLIIYKKDGRVLLNVGGLFTNEDTLLAATFIIKAKNSDTSTILDSITGSLPKALNAVNPIFDSSRNYLEFDISTIDGVIITEINVEITIQKTSASGILRIVGGNILGKFGLASEAEPLINDEDVINTNLIDFPDSANQLEINKNLQDFTKERASEWVLLWNGNKRVDTTLIDFNYNGNFGNFPNNASKGEYDYKLIIIDTSIDNILHICKSPIITPYTKTNSLAMGPLLDFDLVIGRSGESLHLVRLEFTNSNWKILLFTLAFGISVGNYIREIWIRKRQSQEI